MRKIISDKLYTAFASIYLLCCCVQMENLRNKVVPCDANNKMEFMKVWLSKHYSRDY